jgi:predicted double-glycine peptidase
MKRGCPGMKSPRKMVQQILPVVIFLMTCLQPIAVEAVTITGAGGVFHVPVKSFQEKRFQSVIKQQYDFSCGSAALATLLTFHYGRSLDEQAVFQKMYEVGDQEKIRKEGFSMLDMKKYLQSLGYQADGYKLSLDKLAELGVPAITLVNKKGYLHFVVINGISSQEVLIGDPAIGIRAMDRSEFEKVWKGVLLLIRNQANIARAHFNTAKEWSAWNRGPIAAAVDRSALSSLVLSLPLRSDF